MAKRKITIIPSTINPLTQTPVGSVQKRKVAAYARVSTDSDEQYTSYETQKTYYENYIKSKPEWEFVRVYADEGISGTNTKKREGFKSMITDALDGKIDLIVTKSISRFARNTLDTISYIRKLKSAGVEVYFEKENLWSLDSKSEFVLTIMASIAQEESRSISMNVTLGKRWQMQEGKVSFAYSRMLGFKKTENGYAIDKDQAKIVKEIYTDFLIWGMTSTGIANKLTKRGVKTPSGKSEWSKNNIESILTNEKYKGDALLQKTYVVDYLEHKVAMNKGEITQYYVKDSHEAIIDKAEWDMVQDEIKRRKELGATYSASSIFISKLVCGDCGGIYGKKLWHSNDDYRSVRYLCNNKYKDKNKRCTTPALTEKTIIDAFIKAYNSVMVDKNSLIEDAEAIKLLLSDTSKIDTEMDKLNTELQVINGLVDHLVRDNSSRLQSQEEYQKKYDELVTRYQNAKTRYEELSIEKSRKKFQSLRLDMFISKIKESPSLITEWNMEIWSILVDKAIVNSNCSITFRFRNGVEKTIKVKKC